MKKLREFSDTEGTFADRGDSDASIGNNTASSSRTSRSDEGVLALANSVFQHIFGLNDETRSRMLKIIRNQGQWQDLKLSVRQLSGVAHRRLNDVVNMSQDANPSTTPDENVRFNPEHEPGQYDAEGHGHGDRAVRQEFEEYSESNKVSFAGFLLNELTYDENDLRDPQKKNEIQRMMRADDRQAAQLTQRANREQKQENRAEVTQEQDPQKAQLLRKKQGLLQQIAKIDQQLQAPLAGTEDQF